MLKNKQNNKTAKSDIGVRADVTITSALGPINIQLEDDVIVQVEFAHQASNHFPKNSALAKRLQKQFDQYFDDSSHLIDAKTKLYGTAFQTKVWQALRQIPAGEVRTYGQLAAQLGSSPRAVGGALRANPCPIIYPCHRVVAKGSIGGFSGQTDGPKISIKAWLLRHEGLSF